MVKCAVPGCENYRDQHAADQNVKFFCFPANPDLRQKWAVACGLANKRNFKRSRICSEHFTDQDFCLDHLLLPVPDDMRRLKRGIIPTQKLQKTADLEDKEETHVENELMDETVVSNEEADISDPAIQVEECTPMTVESKYEKSESQPINNDLTSLQTLRQENMRLRQEARRLLMQIRKAESIVTNMEKVFTKSQIKRLKFPQKNCNWKYEDVANSISLFAASPAMYQLLCRKKYPFPSPSTLRKWASTLKLRPGVIGSILKNLQSSNSNSKDRLCILAFYEIRLRRPQHSQDRAEAKLRPYKYAQMFIVRGLVSEWKHIVYYNFDCMMPCLVLKDLIRRLRDIDYIVVAVVSGIGLRKQAIWRELKVNEEQPSFQVFNDEKVFCFANVPHIIKRLRNHFLESGFMVHDAFINVEPLNEMLSVETSDLWVSHDLTHAHVAPRKIGQHNLQAALQLFSESVAEAIRKCIAMGKMCSQYADECSNFIQLVDQWFGVFNSKPIPATEDVDNPAYGLALDEQNGILTAMNDAIRNLKLKLNQEVLEPFQTGILLNNCALPLMLDYLKEKHNVQHVMTNNLNADDMEHSFGIRKSNAGVAFRPTRQEFKCRLRAGILANLNIDI